MISASQVHAAAAGLLLFAAVAVGVSAAAGAAAASSETRLSAADQARAVASLRRERAELRDRLRAYSARLDATRMRLSGMTLELARARADYEQTYVRFAGSLVSIYKQQDRFALSEVVADLGLSASLPEFEFFARLAGEQRQAVADLLAQRSRIEVLQQDIAALKSMRLAEEASLRTRLETVDAALKSGVVDLKDARRQLAERQPDSSQSGSPVASLPRPGIGGFLVGANQPPADYGPSGYRFSGLASWYGPGFQGNHTANGEIYNMYGFTCASRTLPFNTWLRLTYSGRALFVRVNDRGPMSPERVLDLSYAAATGLGFSGVAYIGAEVWAP